MNSTPADYISVMDRQPRKLTQADLTAQRNLKRIWNARRGELGLTQQKAAEEFERSQGLIGQYLNGHIALGPVAVLKFANLLQCKPSEIRPDFKLGALMPSELPDDVAEMAAKLAALPKAARHDIIQSINLLIRNGRYIKWVVDISEKTNGAVMTAET